jgi:hypothetical protein
MQLEFIKWKYKESYGLDYSTCYGIFEKFNFDIRHDSDNIDFKKKPIEKYMSYCMTIYFNNVKIKDIFGTRIELLKKYAEKYLIKNT